MAIYVKSFTDRNGNKVNIGDTVGYFNMRKEMMFSSRVVRITKAGYFRQVYVEDRDHPFSVAYIEKVEQKEVN